jgi:hypothetical protein
MLRRISAITSASGAEAAAFRSMPAVTRSTMVARSELGERGEHLDHHPPIIRPGAVVER